MAKKAQALRELEKEKQKYEELQKKLEKEKLDNEREDSRIRSERSRLQQGTISLYQQKSTVFQNE